MTTIDRLRRFYYGRGYVILTALLVLLAHSTVWVNDRTLFGGYQEFIFGAPLVISIAIGCFICDDIRFLIMPTVSATFIVPTLHAPNIPYYSKFYTEHIPLALEYVLGLLLVGSILCFLARNRARRVDLRAPVLFGMLLFCAALMLNGIGSRYHCIPDLVYPLTMVAALAGVYLLFAAYLRFDREIYDYFFFCMLALGLMILGQLLFTYMDPGPDGVRLTASGGVDKNSLLFGWGNSTAMGGMLAFLMPTGFYFAHSHRHGWVYYILSGALYLGVALSQSRGALLAATVTLGISLLVLFFNGANRRINRVFTCLIALAGIGVLVLLSDKLITLVRTMMDFGLSDNGRYEIWSTAIGKFLEYPIFGAGFYTDFFYDGWQKDVYPYLYHNTPIQVLSSGGVVAFAAYAWHRLTTVSLVLRRPDPYKTFLGLCITGLLIFCLFEVIFFATYPTIIYSLMLLFMEKKDEANTATAAAVKG